MARAFSKVKAEDGGVKRIIREALEVIRSYNFDPYLELFTEDAV